MRPSTISGVRTFFKSGIIQCEIPSCKVISYNIKTNELDHCCCRDPLPCMTQGRYQHTYAAQRKLYDAAIRFAMHLHKLGYKVVMHGGAIIGLLRFNHMLPHDGDCDILVIGEKQQTIMDEFNKFNQTHLVIEHCGVPNVPLRIIDKSIRCRGNGQYSKVDRSAFVDVTMLNVMPDGTMTWNEWFKNNMKNTNQVDKYVDWKWNVNDFGPIIISEFDIGR